MKCIILSATAVVLTVAMLMVSSLSGSAQEGYSGQYAPEAQYASDGQYASTTGQEGCGWYWDYNFKKSGAWEWWCWSPTLGWWYGESADGKSKIIAPKINSGGPLQFFSS